MFIALNTAYVGFEIQNTHKMHYIADITCAFSAIFYDVEKVTLKLPTYIKTPKHLVA